MSPCPVGHVRPSQTCQNGHPSCQHDFAEPPTVIPGHLQSLLNAASSRTISRTAGSANSAGGARPPSGRGSDWTRSCGLRRPRALLLRGQLRPLLFGSVAKEEAARLKSAGFLDVEVRACNVASFRDLLASPRPRGSRSGPQTRRREPAPAAPVSDAPRGKAARRRLRRVTALRSGPHARRPVAALLVFVRVPDDIPRVSGL